MLIIERELSDEDIFKIAQENTEVAISARCIYTITELNYMIGQIEKETSPCYIKLNKLYIV